ncbi:hypothetical protein NMG60_11025327 [Bertholletia excelsa]
MSKFWPVRHLLPALAVALVALDMQVHAQSGLVPCTSSMLTTFTPCMNFVTNSSGSGTSPTADCCGSLRSFMSGGMDCLCLIATGRVPFQIPVKRNLAMSLPRACKMSGVPIQCKASSAPIPAPGPIAFSSDEAPASTGPEPISPDLAPEAETTPPTDTTEDPTTADPGIEPNLTPSAATPSRGFSPAMMLPLFGSMVLKFY